MHPRHQPLERRPPHQPGDVRLHVLRQLAREPPYGVRILGDDQPNVRPEPQGVLQRMKPVEKNKIFPLDTLPPLPLGVLDAAGAPMLLTHTADPTAPVPPTKSSPSGA